MGLVVMWAMGWGVVSTCERHVVGCQCNLGLNAMWGLRCPLRDIGWAVMFDMGCDMLCGPWGGMLFGTWGAMCNIP